MPTARAPLPESGTPARTAEAVPLPGVMLDAGGVVSCDPGPAGQAMPSVSAAPLPVANPAAGGTMAAAKRSAAPVGAAGAEAAELLEALRASERRFRSLIENAADIITILDAEGTVRYESPSVARMLGYEPAVRLGRSFFDFVYGEDLPELLAVFSRCLETPGQNHSLEFRCLHRDGSWRIVEGTAKNLLGDPAVSGVVVNAREVTERKRAQEAQARLTAVMDATPDVVVTAGPHGRLSYVNQAGRRLLGLESGVEISALNLSDIHPAWANDLILNEGLPTAIREGVWTGETALTGHDGREIPVLQVMLAHAGPDGAIEFFSTTARDITERKAAEEALRQSEQVLRQIAENINEALWIYDLKEKRPLYVSPGYERIWGRPVAAAYADPGPLITPLAEAGVAVGEWAEVLAKLEGREEREFVIERPDGATRWLRGRWFPIREMGGEVSRIVGLTEDITERKQLEVELRRAQRLEAIGHLAAGIAHEINTPIQYVGDNLRFLQEGFAELTRFVGEWRELLGVVLTGSSAAELAERVATIGEELDVDYTLEEAPKAIVQALEGVKRVAEIVRAMKEFSHPGTTEKIPTDINRAIQSTVTVARNEWKYVAELATELDPTLPPVPCLPADFNQAMLNIVVNAAHAIADVVGDGSKGRGRIEIRTRREGEWVEIRVSDSGAGIPEDARPRIFDPFFTTKAVGRGTGQGLTIAHAVIVEKHGGTITFETEIGVGTTFIVRLPLEPDGAAERSITR